VTGRQVGAALGFAALGAVVALAVNAVATDDGGTPADGGSPSPAANPTFERPDEATNPEAAEFYDLVTAFQNLTLHATYRVTATAETTPSIIEIWQKDGQFRQETTVATEAGQAGRILVLHLVDRTVLCQQPPDGDYACTLLPESQESAFSSLRTGLLAGLGDQEVTVRDDVIGDFTVRCFSIEITEPSTGSTGPSDAPSEENELCATDEGVIVTIAGAEGTFELLDLQRTVDDDVFVPPATPGV
jgi:hypothetical protein